MKSLSEHLHVECSMHCTIASIAINDAVASRSASSAVAKQFVWFGSGSLGLRTKSSPMYISEHDFPH
jgi:tagatose-1,6-bisphosphate aldolase non-catalytic subunit AgaZ/GatZ